MAQNGKSRDDGYFETLSAQMEQTDALFAKLSSGEHPNFLAVMAGISEMVAFYTDHDINVEGPSSDREKESQKNCRFCS